MDIFTKSLLLWEGRGKYIWCVGGGGGIYMPLKRPCRKPTFSSHRKEIRRRLKKRERERENVKKKKKERKKTQKKPQELELFNVKKRKISKPV